MFRWMVAALAVAALAACNPVAQAEGAREEVDRFHERLNAGEDDAIWANAGEPFRETTTRQEFSRLLGTVRKSLGEVQETSQVGVNMNTNMQGSFTTVRMETHFERGRGMETFVFTGSGEELVLVGYHINSPDMMSDVFDTYAGEEGEGAQSGEGEEPLEVVGDPSGTAQ